ncbi:RHS repeat-associated core domain-containing protein, partial [Methylobacterium indicum]|uniref:RHS repeat-associated core domain-containing protein n=1 Tax=Methylobacterium indicum TaxID=1775910 RepID=UPI001A957E4E
RQRQMVIRDRVHAVAGNLALASAPGVVEAVLLCPLRFQGQWQDAETGLVYNRFRYYDPLTANYVSSDPIGLTGGIRPHAYIVQPTVWIDPFGLSCCVGVDQSHIDELKRKGVKFTPESVLATGRDRNGNVVFLESGNIKSGLNHIIQKHGSDFASIGVPEGEIKDVVMRAVTEGNIIGYQGAGTGRPIFELPLNGYRQRIAVTIGDNGYIVGANPRGRIR